MGFLIGFVSRLAKVGTGWSPETGASQPCPPALVESMTPVDSN
jgi:hypothetical protein